MVKDKPAWRLVLPEVTGSSITCADCMRDDKAEQFLEGVEYRAMSRTMDRTGKAHPESKPCMICGRAIVWRKKWERDWEEVRYCSDGCRRRARSGEAAGVDAALEAAILELLAERGAGKTICPSEAARRVGGPEETWRSLMEPARAAARRLHAAGRLTITQGGHSVDPSRAKGPIRLKLL